MNGMLTFDVRRGWAGSPVDNMDQGLNIANRIIIDLRKMMPSAWGLLIVKHLLDNYYDQYFL